jgi:uncharacterized protein with LGFP repeats
MRAYRAAVLSTAAIAVIAAVVTGVAHAAAGGAENCAAFPDASQRSVTHQVCGPILARYRSEGGPAGRLGLPTSDEGPVTVAALQGQADRQVAFQGGTIYLEESTGETTIGRWVAYRPLQPSPN